MVRRKKYWYHRWREQHPLIQLYVTKEQYNMIKSIADSQNKTIKELVLDAINRLVDFEKWKREYELRIAELSKELRDKESDVLGLKNKIDMLKKLIADIYSCVDQRTRREDLCRSVCIDVKDFRYTYGVYTYTYDKLVLDVDKNCLKNVMQKVDRG
jgi:hypothetical protein